MADTLPLAQSGEVKAFDRLGNKILVPRDKVAELQKLGGRIATPQEVAESELQRQYDKQSTVAKVAGGLTGVVLPPELDAYRQGAASGLSAGLVQGVTRQALDVVDKRAGAAYEKHERDLQAAHEGAYKAGELGGLAGQIAISAAAGAGPGAGLARMLPANAIAAAGAPVEAAAARAFGGLVARGALARAAAAGGELAARGAVEGALYGATQSLSEDMLGDREVVADRLFAATGMGALYGALGGAVLGSGGSLVKSAGRAVASKAASGLARMSTSADDVARTVGTETQAVARAADSTLDDAARAVGVDASQETGAIRKALSGNADDAVRGIAQERAANAVLGGFGLQSTRYAKQAAKYFPNGKRDLGEVALRYGVIDAKGAVVDAAMAGTPAELLPKLQTAMSGVGQRIGEITEASGARVAIEDLDDAILRIRSYWAKQAGREHVVRAIDDYRESLIGKLRFRETPRARPAVIDADAGLSPGPNRLPMPIEIGAEQRPVLLKDYGRTDRVIRAAEMPPLASRAKFPDPDAGLPRVMSIDPDAGLAIGAPEASEAFKMSAAKNVPRSVSLGDVEAASASSKRAVSLGSPLGKLERTTSVQELLEQRRFLDDIVYQETRTMDPKARVAALREVRSGMEDVITKSLDDASGKVKGELAAEYKALKKDFHALRILEEAAEDSAARAAKGSTLGLGEKFAVAQALASGNIAAAPVLGLGMKFIRERGDAAAAVFLSKMADLGTASRVMAKLEEQLGHSARGLVSTPSKGGAYRTQANPIVEARKAEKQIAELSSRPELVVQRAATLTQGLAANAPNAAGGVARSMVRALTFLSSKLPPQRAPDPLEPERSRGWSQTEAEKFVRYVRAARDPLSVLEDAERGKVTHEGLETLQALAPTLYRDLQMKTMSAIADQIAKGKPIPFEKRLRLGALFGIAADPSLRPETMRFLQSNVMPPPQQGGKKSKGASAPARPVKFPTQHSALDRISER